MRISLLHVQFHEGNNLFPLLSLLYVAGALRDAGHRVHATAESASTLHDLPADIFVRGEGEATTVEIAGRLASGQSLDGILGTVTGAGRAPDRPPREDLDSLPRTGPAGLRALPVRPGSDSGACLGSTRLGDGRARVSLPLHLLRQPPPAPPRPAPAGRGRTHRRYSPGLVCCRPGRRDGMAAGFGTLRPEPAFPVDSSALFFLGIFCL